MTRLAEHRSGLNHGGLGAIQVGQLAQDCQGGVGARLTPGSEDLEVLRIPQARPVDLLGIGVVAEQGEGLLAGERSEVPYLEPARGGGAGQHCGQRGRELALAIGQQAKHRTGGGRVEQPLHPRNLVGRQLMQVIHGHQRGCTHCQLLVQITAAIRRRADGAGRGGERTPTVCREHPDSGGLGVRGRRQHQRALADTRIPDQRDGTSSARSQLTQCRQHVLGLGLPAHRPRSTSGQRTGQRCHLAEGGKCAGVRPRAAGQEVISPPWPRR